MAEHCKTHKTLIFLTFAGVLRIWGA